MQEHEPTMIVQMREAVYSTDVGGKIMNNSSIRDTENQQSINSRDNLRKGDRRRQLHCAKKRSVRRNRPRCAGSTFPSLTELPLHIWLLLVIILMMFITNHIAVPDLILLLKFIKTW